MDTIATIGILGGMTLIKIACAFVIFIVIELGFLFIGFWMGRKTQDKTVITPDVNRNTKYAHGQPVLDEYDAYADAMSDKEFEETVR